MFSLKEICLILFSIVFLQLSSGEVIDEKEYLNDLLKRGDYKKFSELTKASENVVRKIPLYFDIYMKIVAQEFGDLMVQPEQYYMKPGDPLKHHNGVLLGMWDKIVPYIILPHNYTEEQVSKIEENIRSWNYRFSGVLEFQHKRPNDKDGIVIFNGNGCFSNYGRLGGLQAMSLDANYPGQPCLTVGWTHHEMMHAIGMMHTNARQDRDFYVRTYVDNVVYSLRNVYSDITPDPSNPPAANQSITKILGPYEYDSIMHLQSRFFKTEPYYFDVLRSDKVDLETVGLPELMDLTALDEENVRNLYVTR